MQIFGVGPLELLLIFVLALVIMGPQDMVGTARRLGRWVYNLVRSPTWRAIMETTQEFRDLPQKIVRDAGLDEAMKEIKDTADQVKSEMEATTREINTEMQAATNEITSEFNSAAQEVNHGLQQTANTAEMPAGVAPFASGEPATETNPADMAAVSDQVAPAQSLDELNPESILWPELGAESQPEAAASADPESVVTQPDPYVVCLDTFATALGGTMKSPGALEMAPAPDVPQTITPEMIASAPAAEPEAPQASEPVSRWAPGLVLSGPAEVDMQARFQEQMAAMEKSFEELDAKIMASQAASTEEPALTEEAANSDPEVSVPAAAPEESAGEVGAEFGAAQETEHNSPEDQPAG